MPRSPAKALASTVASAADTEIPTGAGAPEPGRPRWRPSNVRSSDSRTGPSCGLRDAEQRELVGPR